MPPRNEAPAVDLTLVRVVAQQLDRLGYSSVPNARLDIMGWNHSKLSMCSIVDGAYKDASRILESESDEGSKLQQLVDDAAANYYTLEGTLRSLTFQALSQQAGADSPWRSITLPPAISADDFAELSRQYAFVPDSFLARCSRPDIERKLRASGAAGLAELAAKHQPALDYLLEDAAWMELDWDATREREINWEVWEHLDYLDVRADIREAQTHAAAIFEFAASLLQTYPDHRFIFLAQGSDMIYEAARFLAATNPDWHVRPENLVRFEAAVSSEICLHREQPVVVVDEIMVSGRTALENLGLIQARHRHLYGTDGSIFFEVMAERMGDPEIPRSDEANALLARSKLAYPHSGASSRRSAARYLDHSVSPRDTIETKADWRDISVHSSEPFEIHSAEYWARRQLLLASRGA